MIPTRAANINVALHVVPPFLDKAIAGAISRLEILCAVVFGSAMYASSDVLRPTLILPFIRAIVAGMAPVDLSPDSCQLYLYLKVK